MRLEEAAAHLDWCVIRGGGSDGVVGGVPSGSKGSVQSNGGVQNHAQIDVLGDAGKGAGATDVLAKDVLTLDTLLKIAELKVAENQMRGTLIRKLQVQ